MHEKKIKRKKLIISYCALQEKSASEAGASSMDHSPGPDHIEHNSRRNDSPSNKGTDNLLSNDNINNSNIASRSNQAPQLHLSENDGSDESGPTSDEELEYKEKDGNDNNNATSQPKVNTGNTFKFSCKL